jgi:hypothetical protein
MNKRTRKLILLMPKTGPALQKVEKEEKPPASVIEEN